MRGKVRFFLWCAVGGFCCQAVFALAIAFAPRSPSVLSRWTSPADGGAWIGYDGVGWSCLWIDTWDERKGGARYTGGAFSSVFPPPVPVQEAGEKRLPSWSQSASVERAKLAEAKQAFAWCEVAVGWPVRCLTTATWRGSPERVEHGLRVLRLRKRGSPDRQLVCGGFVPTRVLEWPMLINSVAWGIPLGGAGLVARRMFRRARTQPRRCSQCGYSLVGLTASKCPECGTPLPTLC